MAAYTARLAALRAALHAAADAAERAGQLPAPPQPGARAPPGARGGTGGRNAPEPSHDGGGGAGAGRGAQGLGPEPAADPAAGVEAVLRALVSAWEELKAAEEARAAADAAEFRSKTREAPGTSEEARGRTLTLIFWRARARSECAVWAARCMLCSRRG